MIEKYLYTELEAAQITGLTPRQLQKARMDGTGPQFVRISSRCIRYCKSDLNDWLRAHLADPSCPPDEGPTGDGAA